MYARATQTSKARATNGKFGKARNVDAESQKPKLQTRTTKPTPRYGFVSQEKGEQDTHEDDKLEEEIEKERDQGRPDDTQKDAGSDMKEREQRKERDTGPTQPPTKATQSASATPSKPGNNYMKMWSLAQHVSMDAVRKPKTSWYQPSFLVAFQIIQTMSLILDGNSRLSKICPEYSHQAVLIYYSVLFFVQILRAQRDAKKIQKSDSTWLRAFERIYPLESLPVAGPLEPYFNSLAAVKTSDPMFEWIVPKVKSYGPATAKSATAFSDSTLAMIPGLPWIIERFRLMLTANLDDTFQVGTGNAARTVKRFELNGNFIINSWSEDFSFARHAWTANTFTGQALFLVNLLGLNTAPVETIDTIKETRRLWRNFQLPEELIDTTDLSTVGGFVRMTEDFEWFGEFIDKAAVHAKFFSGSTNMSNIDTVGGEEVLISTQYDNPITQIVTPSGWYPEKFKLTGKFQTTRGTTEEHHFFNAATTQVLAQLPTTNWIPGWAGAGGKASGHRLGPYFDVTLFQFDTHDKINVLGSLKTVIRTEFYDSKGEASK